MNRNVGVLACEFQRRLAGSDSFLHTFTSMCTGRCTYSQPGRLRYIPKINGLRPFRPHFSDLILLPSIVGTR